MLGYTFDDCKASLHNCEICPLAKHTRFPFPSSTTRSNVYLTTFGCLGSI